MRFEPWSTCLAKAPETALDNRWWMLQSASGAASGTSAGKPGQKGRSELGVKNFLLGEKRPGFQSEVTTSLPRNFSLELKLELRLMLGLGQHRDFPHGSSGKESTCQCRSPRFNPWVRKIPWRRKWQPAPVMLPGKIHGQRSLVGYSSWGHKESDMTEWLSRHA